MPVIPVTLGTINRRIAVQAGPGIKQDLILTITKRLEAWFRW
jgi:hypothetical protein